MVRAILRTQCGCRREMGLPYPPPRDVRVPIIAPISTDPNGCDSLRIRYRKFNLVDWWGDSNRCLAEYLEEPLDK